MLSVKFVSDGHMVITVINNYPVSHKATVTGCQRYCWIDIDILHFAPK